jgi:acyl dehydratase
MTTFNDQHRDGRLYLDDLTVGQRFMSGTRVVDEAEIKAFARQFDPQPFHLDSDAAKSTLFGAGGEIAWPKPTRPGDTLQVESEVLEITPSRSRPDRGVAMIRSLTRNQKNEIVQSLTSRLIVPRRPG